MPDDTLMLLVNAATSAHSECCPSPLPEGWNTIWKLWDIFLSQFLFKKKKKNYWHWTYPNPYPNSLSMLRAIKVKILILKVTNFYFPSKLNLYLFLPFFCKRFCLPSCKTIISLFQNSLFSKMYLNHSVFEFLCWLNFKKQDIIWQNNFLCSRTNLGIWEI